MPEHQKVSARPQINDVLSARPKMPPFMQNSHPSAIIQKARIHPESLSHEDVMQLQRTIGNRAVMQLFQTIGLKEPVRNNDSLQEKGVVQRVMIPAGVWDGDRDLDSDAADFRTQYINANSGQRQAIINYLKEHSGKDGDYVVIPEDYHENPNSILHRIYVPTSATASAPGGQGTNPITNQTLSALPNMPATINAPVSGPNYVINIHGNDEHAAVAAATSVNTALPAPARGGQTLSNPLPVSTTATASALSGGQVLIEMTSPASTTATASTSAPEQQEQTALSNSGIIIRIDNLAFSIPRSSPEPEPAPGPAPVTTPTSVVPFSTSTMPAPRAGQVFSDMNALGQQQQAVAPSTPGPRGNRRSLCERLAQKGCGGTTFGEVSNAFGVSSITATLATGNPNVSGSFGILGGAGVTAGGISQILCPGSGLDMVKGIFNLDSGVCGIASGVATMLTAEGLSDLLGRASGVCWGLAEVITIVQKAKDYYSGTNRYQSTIHLLSSLSKLAAGATIAISGTELALLISILGGFGALGSGILGCCKLCRICRGKDNSEPDNGLPPPPPVADMV